LEVAREFRRNPTPQEQQVWEWVRDRKLEGLKFRRQQIIRGFVADFYCAEHRLAVELDGTIHDSPEAQEYDSMRDEVFRSVNVRVLRIPNEECTKDNLRTTVLSALSASPLSIHGEGGRGGEVVWRPAAGTFDGWPKAAKDITVMDPCMGSGHFLVFALPILVAFRMEEEGLSKGEAVCAVLRDNLHGLEIDQRCSQIAAFNLALTAWKMAGYRALPRLSLACSGLSTGVSKSEWIRLAERAAASSPVPPRRLDLLTTEQNIFSTKIIKGLERLHDLFEQAPVLGSLIDPRRGSADILGGASYKELQPVLGGLLATSRGTDELEELAVAAQGMARAAELLSQTFTLVTTNVPYLGRALQCEALQDFSASSSDAAKMDLCVTFLLRILHLLEPAGSYAAVLPQNWWFLNGYQAFRTQLLASTILHMAVALGEEAWRTFGNRGPRTVLQVGTRTEPRPSSKFWALDVSSGYSGAVIEYDQKPPMLSGLGTSPEAIRQDHLVRDPAAKIVLKLLPATPSLRRHVIAAEGLSTGDNPRYVRFFWELLRNDEWEPYAGSSGNGDLYGGRESVVHWLGGRGSLASSSQARVQGLNVWGKQGVLVGRIRGISVSIYNGTPFDKACVAICPNSPELGIGTLLAFIASREFEAYLRTIDQKVAAATSAVTAVPFELKRWAEVAAEQHPDGIPPPFSADPSQWAFSGCTSDAAQPLQVAVARLAGYRWPRQDTEGFGGCPAVAPDGLDKHADADGIVCLTSLHGEASAADRLRALLADAYGSEWSAAKLNELLHAVGFVGKTLDEWLADGFFEQHCTLFHQRPFVWHIWDGLRGGFSALVNYHKLSSPLSSPPLAIHGEGGRGGEVVLSPSPFMERGPGGEVVLEKLIYTYLGDWIDRQRADQARGVEGADARVAASEHLKKELEKILEGEPPYDLFVRWKPLHEQAIGWEPDVNDGVRLNIRPFMTAKPSNARARNACILRVTPRIWWDKDRGKELTRAREDFPWFWSWDGETQDFMGDKAFDGNRWNDLHYSRAAKAAARELKKGGAS